jgi:hypothetical protein
MDIPAHEEQLAVISQHRHDVGQIEFLEGEVARLKSVLERIAGFDADCRLHPRHFIAIAREALKRE